MTTTKIGTKQEAQIKAITVECPFCGAKVGDWCRSKAATRPGDAHGARLKLTASKSAKPAASRKTRRAAKSAKTRKPAKPAVTVSEMAHVFRLLNGEDKRRQRSLGWYSFGGGADDIREFDDCVDWEPMDRQRLDHYGNDGQGWDEMGWEDEYATPTRKRVQDAMDAHFGAGRVDVYVDEKGFVTARAAK
jgi:hypothetical protein